MPCGWRAQAPCRSRSTWPDATGDAGQPQASGSHGISAPLDRAKARMRDLFSTLAAVSSADEIRRLVESWAVWRDANDWERFRTVWHDDGRMMATWFQGSADEFIRVSREGFERGVSILHFLGGTSIDLAGNRAIAQTKMTISQRASVDGV